MGPKSKASRAAAKTSRKASTGAASQAPLKITPKQRAAVVQAVEEVDLTQQDPAPIAAAAAAAVDSSTSGTYILIRSVVVESEVQEELERKSELVKPGSFDFAEFNIRALKLGVERLKLTQYNRSVLTYAIRRGGPNGKLELYDEIESPEDFATAERLLVAMAAGTSSKAPWCLKITRSFFVKSSTAAEGEDDDSSSESSSDEERAAEVVKKLEKKAASSTGKEKSTKRKRATTTARMEVEVEEKLQRELTDELRIWGTRIACANPCSLKEKCPGRGGICINYQDQHLTVFPSIVRLWEKACVEGLADEYMPTEQLLKMMLDSRRIKEDSTSAKKLRAKYDLSSTPTPAAPATQPIVIQAPAPAPAVITASPPQLGIHDIFQAILLKQLTDSQKQSYKSPQLGYNPYSQLCAPSPIAAPMQAPVGVPPWMHHQLLSQTQPQLLQSIPQQPAPKILQNSTSIKSTAQSTSDLNSITSTQGALPTSYPTARIPQISAPLIQPSQSRPSTPRAASGPKALSPPQPNFEQQKLQAFFRYIIAQSPYQTNEIIDMEFQLCEEHGFSWKVLSRTLRTPDKGLQVLQPIVRKVGLILLMAQHLDGFRKQ